jgi:hypothetical protein
MRMVTGSLNQKAFNQCGVESDVECVVEYDFGSASSYSKLPVRSLAMHLGYYHSRYPLRREPLAYAES